jgi:ubiquinone/menaquinone biosynthesis C-methylase UbiE
MALLEQTRLFLTRLDRLGRNIFTLNRDREYMALRRMLDLGQTDILLDVGSGDGFRTARFSRYCEYVVGQDPSQRSVEFGEAYDSRSNILYTCAVAEYLPFLDGVFNKVVSISCLEHFADPLQGLRELVRVLKPSGSLALSVDSLLPVNSPVEFREWHSRRHFCDALFRARVFACGNERIGVAS